MTPINGLIQAQQKNARLQARLAQVEAQRDSLFRRVGRLEDQLREANKRRILLELPKKDGGITPGFDTAVQHAVVNLGQTIILTASPHTEQFRVFWRVDVSDKHDSVWASGSRDLCAVLTAAQQSFALRKFNRKQEKQVSRCI